MDNECYPSSRQRMPGRFTGAIPPRHPGIRECWSSQRHRPLFDVITGATGNCWSIHTNCPVPGPVPASPANNDFKPGFAAALMNKDLGLAMDAVRSTDSNAPLGSHAAEIYAKFAADHADKDFSAIIEMLRNS
jgi:3-hydroxyisobutyrate dehydrogenase